MECLFIARTGRQKNAKSVDMKMNEGQLLIFGASKIRYFIDAARPVNWHRVTSEDTASKV